MDDVCIYTLPSLTMFFKTFLLRLRCLIETIMSHTASSDADFFFPTVEFIGGVEYWAQSALYDPIASPIAATSTVTSVSHYKERQDACHEFVVVDIAVAPDNKIALIITDRGPDRNELSSSSPMPFVSPSTSKGSRSKATFIHAVKSNDRVMVAPEGTRAHTLLLMQEKFKDYCLVSTLDFSQSPTRMTAAQVAVILKVTHTCGRQYAANDKSCYWYVFTIMEAIRTRWEAKEIEGEDFKDKSKIWGKKMDVEGSVNTVLLCYDEKWANHMQHMQKKEVIFLLLFHLMTEFEVL